MKNFKIISLWMFILSASSSFSQVNLILNPLSSAAICDLNVLSGTIQLGPNLPTSFNISISGQIYDGTTLISLPYPACGDITPPPGSNPVQIELDHANFGLVNGVQVATLNPIPSHNPITISSFEPGVYQYQLSTSDHYLFHGKLDIIR